MTKKQEDNNEQEILYGYSRAQAFKDGQLVDVSQTAREAGFTMPVALTNAVYVSCVRVPRDVTGQDVPGRLWDVLWMLRHRIRSSNGVGGDIRFELYVRNTDEQPAGLVHLRCVCGPGDAAEPVLTVMLPGVE